MYIQRFVDKDLDKKVNRTKSRPIAAGKFLLIDLLYMLEFYAVWLLDFNPV